MNLHDKTIKRSEVTTGPLTGSRKVYSAPDGHDELAVPFREIALAENATFQVYDTSGSYTDDQANIVGPAPEIEHPRAPASMAA